jgi:hypothetical protein
MNTLLMIAAALFLGYFTGRRCRSSEARQEGWEAEWDARELLDSNPEGLKRFYGAVTGPWREEEGN